MLFQFKRSAIDGVYVPKDIVRPPTHATSRGMDELGMAWLYSRLGRRLECNCSVQPILLNDSVFMTTALIDMI